MCSFRSCWSFGHFRHADTPFRPLALSPFRRFAVSPYRLSAIGYSEIPVALDVALTYDFAAAVDQVEFAEFVVFILQIDCPVAAPGSSGIGTPGLPADLTEFGVLARIDLDRYCAVFSNAH